MGYRLTLVDKETKKALESAMPHNIYGGEYTVGRLSELSLYITYNYSEYFEQTLGKGGIKNIYGLTGAESIPILQNAISELKGKPSEDYWLPTSGNAKMALMQLLQLAQLRPDGVWEGE